jgi:dienelactone hydrolase
MYSNKTYPDSSTDFCVTTSMGNDSIAFGPARILFTTLSYKSSNGDSLHTELWLPAGRPFDTSSIILLFPGYGERTYTLYPLAESAARAGIPVAFLSARGLDMNDRVKRDFYFSELQDAKDALAEYALEQKLHTLKVGAFGYSLGAVLALDLAHSDHEVRGAVLESVMMDPIATASRVVKGDDYDTLMNLVTAHPEIRSWSTQEVLRNWQTSMPLLFVWGSKDDVVPKPDRDSVAALALQHDPQASVNVIDRAPHVMRFGFPMNQKDALALNDSIVSFLKRAMQ